MPNVMQYEPFAALADVYGVSGLSAYAEAMGPRLMDLAFRFEWVGGTAYDMGCGTGELAGYLAEQGLRVFAVDTSREMLSLAQAATAPKGLSLEFYQADLRTYKPEVAIDLVICVGGTLNLLPNLVDLEAAIRAASAALDTGKLFIFDMFTIRGLAAGNGTRIVADNPENLLVVSHGQFSYETLSLSTAYHILTHSGLDWHRSLEKHTLRGYPLQGVQRLLTKYGLKLLRTMDTAMQPVDPNDVDQVILLARKEG